MRCQLWEAELNGFHGEFEVGAEATLKLCDGTTRRYYHPLTLLQLIPAIDISDLEH